MNIKTINVGGSFPGEVAYSNVSMEIVAEVSPDENIERISDELKVQVARLVSGGNSFKAERALEIMNYPRLKVREEDLIGELNETEAKIAQLEDRISSRRTQLYALAGLSDQLNEIEDVCEFYGMASEFWKTATAVMAKRGERSPRLSAATETKDDLDDSDPVPY